jgi:ketosteroid isomerase-like protein
VCAAGHSTTTIKDTPAVRAGGQNVPMTREQLLAWIDGYERAWRMAGSAQLAALFSKDAVYRQSPYADPHVGLPAIAAMWDNERDGPDEVFTMTREVVAVEGDTGVARVVVRYGDPVAQEYTDLWVVRLDSAGRCVEFEEWAYWPGSPWVANP